MSDSKKLFKVTVQLAKLPKSGSKGREGYIDEGKQVFMPPVSTKRVSAWKKKLEEKGYAFTS
jgi:hypothetical protein